MRIKNLILILTGAATLASCAGHDVLSDDDLRGERADQVMAFSVLSSNLGRATAMEAAGHTDFGVFAYKGTNGYYPPDHPGDLVMQNYQVKYGESEVYGSRWYYEGARPGQILKYWDYSKPSHYFAAYTPYNEGSSFSVLPSFPLDDTYNFSITLNGLEAFYHENERDDKEAMCAATKVDKADYGQEVPLTFHHLNAIIQLAFRSNIPGYTVELLDLVPEDVTVKTGEGEGQTTAAARGVQLTPATETAANKPISWASGTAYPQSSPTDNYITSAQMTVSQMFSPSATVAVSNATFTDANLEFALDDTDAAVKAFPISAGSDYTPLKSQFYALPQDPHHPESRRETSFTVHVTYRLIPNDGAAPTTVYDARVFIPADKCAWTFGKRYLYRFTITTGSTGVTNPSTPVYDDGNTPLPYIDPRDPRVPTNKALLPIVFDGVTVNSYTTETIHYDNIN